MAAETIQSNKATIDDLYRVKGKAELVNGEIVHIAPAGDLPSCAGAAIFISLRSYTKSTGRGRAISGNSAFIVELPNRESFSPDAAYYIGKRTGMKFYEGAPVFAVKVRSEGDYGPQAEREMAQKRADYFSAGTLVVWDVDLLAEEYVVKVYRASDPANPVGYRRGELAEAEPAVPGWSMPVNDLFV